MLNNTIILIGRLTGRPDRPGLPSSPLGPGSPRSPGEPCCPSGPGIPVSPFVDIRYIYYNNHSYCVKLVNIQVLQVAQQDQQVPVDQVDPLHLAAHLILVVQEFLDHLVYQVHLDFLGHLVVLLHPEITVMNDG